MGMNRPGPPMEAMEPRCEACLEEDANVRRMLLLAGQKHLMVPAAQWRSPYLCINCRNRVINFVRQIIAMEQAEVAESLGMTGPPEGTPA